MTVFSSELSGSLIFKSGSSDQAKLIPGQNLLSLTASLNVTGSDIKFNGSSIIDRIETLEAGSGGGASLLPLNRHSQSINEFTASLNFYTESNDSTISSINTFTSSIDTRVSRIEVITGSYLTLETLPTGTVSSSTQISESGFLTSASAADLGFGEGSGTDIPAGTVSSSQQILDLGFVTGSDAISASYASFAETSSLANTASYISATNIDGTVVSSSFAITASYIDPDFISQSAAAAGFSDSEIPAGTISSSEQISAFGYITSSEGGITDTGSFAVTSSNTFTGSQFFSGSLIPEALSSENGIHDLGSLSKPWRDLYITTGSVNFVRDGELVSTVTGERNAIRVGNILITTSSISVVEGSGDNLTNIQTVVEANVSSSGEVTETNQVTAPDGTISSSAQIEALGFVTSSGDSIPDGTVSSSAQIDGLGFVSSSRYNLDSASFDTRIDNISAGSAPAGTISSSAQVSQSAASEGFSTSYDGNRIVSSEYFPGLTGSVNLGTSGSIQNFLDALFFPNTAPTFTTNANQDVTEFATSGSTLLTLVATDAEGQSLTFSTGSGYTDDFLRVASDGTITFNVVPTVENFNTDDRGDGTLAHPIDIVVTDAFGTSTTQTFYFTVTANSAPVFRQTSIAGSIISTFTANRNENASTGEVGKIYFTDANSDAITIRSSSDPNGHFSLTKYSTYVQIDQVTSSLDYESITSYTMALTASDEHYEAAQDTDASSSLTITINVTDNLNPTINNQTLSSISENSANGASVGSIAASDSEGDTITFSNFTLTKLELDNVDVPTGSYGGTSQATDPHENPFQMSNTGAVTRRNGVFINSDLINEYQYSVIVKDQFNSASNQATITIPITDDPAPTISDNWSGGPYIIESAVDGDQIKINSNGRTGTQARFTANQSVTWEVNPTSSFAISSTGYLTVNRDISGSSDTSGDTISGQVTASNSFGTSTSTTFDVSVTTNNAPDIIFSDNSANLNTNGARSGSTLTTITFSDVEGDTLDHDSFVFSEGSGNINALRSGNTYYAQPTTNLTAGNYTYSVTIKDEHGFNTNTENHTITIAQAPTGSLTTNGTFYIIESALSGSNIVINSNGRTGTQGDLGVTYSPQYNSAAVESFTSSNAAIEVDNSGGLTLNTNLSGSTTSSGDDIVSTITFRDQFDNIGSGSITINVTLNAAPTVTITDNGLNTDAATSGSSIASVSISDSEDDSPYILTITGDDAGAFNPVPQNAASSSWNLLATASLSAGTYSITASANDTFARTGSATADITVTQAADYGKFYIYTSTRTGGGTLSTSNYNNIMGISSVNSDTPPEITAFTADTTSPVQRFKTGYLSSSSISVGGGTMTLRATASGSSPSQSLLDIGSFSGDGSTAEQILFIYPSGSDLAGVPTSIVESFGGSDAGDYVLNVNDAGSFSNTISGGRLNLLELDAAHEGYDHWFIIGRTGTNTASTFEARLTAESGSAPT